MLALAGAGRDAGVTGALQAVGGALTACAPPPLREPLRRDGAPNRLRERARRDGVAQASPRARGSRWRSSSVSASARVAMAYHTRHHQTTALPRDPTAPPAPSPALRVDFEGARGAGQRGSISQVTWRDAGRGTGRGSRA